MSNPDFTQARWIKSSYSEPKGNCVELAAIDEMIGIRDSKLGDTSPTLTFTRSEARAFLDGARNVDHLP